MIAFIRGTRTPVNTVVTQQRSRPTATSRIPYRAGALYGVARYAIDPAGARRLWTLSGELRLAVQEVIPDWMAASWKGIGCLVRNMSAALRSGTNRLTPIGSGGFFEERPRLTKPNSPVERCRAD